MPEETKAALGQALRSAFRQCQVMGLPLTEVQQQVIQQVTQTLLLASQSDPSLMTEPEINPLAELTADQRQLLLDYVEQCDRLNQDWKATLLNDWLQGRASGSVQFLRDRFGITWVNQIQPKHLATYSDNPAAQIQVGDRIELSSRLWEWIPDEADQNPEWAIATVISVSQTQDGEAMQLNCIVRFETGLELELSGLNDWNQHNWRWPNRPSSSNTP